MSRVSDPSPVSQRRSSLVWSGLALLLAAATACSEQRPPAAPDEPRPVRIAVAEGISNSPDVGLAEVWRSFAYEALTNRGNDGRAQPRLAKSWALSPDGLRWTLTLRDGITWHDGEPLDAEGAADAVRRALASRQRSALFPGLHDVRDVRATGNGIEISVNTPSAFLIDDLDIRLQRVATTGQPLGTGPYVPVDVTPTRVEMRAHSRYYDGSPKIDSLVLSSSPTTRQAWADLLRGDLDALWNVSGDAAEFLNGDIIDARSFPRRYVYVMAFNSGRPALSNPTVRRALNSAVDRQAILAEVLGGHGRPAWSPVWPEHWAYGAAASPFSFDPSLAKAALASAGYPSDGGNRRLRLTCLVPEGIDVVERLALSLQRALNDVGVDLLFESVSLSQMEARMASGQFDAVLLDLLSGPSLSRVYSFWRSPHGAPTLNIFGYRDRTVDDALDALMRNVDEARVRAATAQLQAGFARNPPGLFIAWSERTRAVSRTIEAPASPGRDPFQPIWQWRFRPSFEIGSLRSAK